MNFSKLDLVILCGGKGSRLRGLKKNLPKPLLKFNNIEFITYLLNFYKKYNFNKIYLLAGYKSKHFKKFNNKVLNGIKVEVIIEKKLLGTAGALRQLKTKKIKNFLLINGDSFFNYKLEKFLKLKSNLVKMMLLKNNNYETNNKLSSLSINKKKIINTKNDIKYMNSGVYFLKKEFLDKISLKKTSLEEDILPPLINEGKVIGNYINSNFLDIGTKKNFIRGAKFLSNEFKKPAVFLDRDGVINFDTGYVHKFKNFKWMPGSIKGLKFINQKDYYLFIITNQSGIGRGYFTEDQFHTLTNNIKTFLIKKNIFIDDIEYCPHHPTKARGKYLKKCMCRKPKNKMIKNILGRWLIDTKKSIMIGDSKKDKLCAEKSGLKFFFRETNLYNQLKKIIN